MPTATSEGFFPTLLTKYACFPNLTVSFFGGFHASFRVRSLREYCRGADAADKVDLEERRSRRPLSVKLNGFFSIDRSAAAKRLRRFCSIEAVSGVRCFERLWQRCIRNLRPRCLTRIRHVMPPERIRRR